MLDFFWSWFVLFNFFLFHPLHLLAELEKEKAAHDLVKEEYNQLMNEMENV